jgi:hypothetical protein
MNNELEGVCKETVVTWGTIPKFTRRNSVKRRNNADYRNVCTHIKDLFKGTKKIKFLLRNALTIELSVPVQQIIAPVT